VASAVDDGTPNEASTSTDNSVSFDSTAPTTTISHASGQDDPTAASPINFAVVFSEPVTGFGSADVTVGGTAGATTVEVTGSGVSYNVAVSGMTDGGTVTASVAEGAATDAAGNASTASDEGVVTYTVTPPAVLSITSIDPNLIASCICPYAIVVTGTGFVPGMSLTFTGGSGPVPSASNIVVTADGTSLTASLTLKSGGPRRPRIWDLTATLPDGTSDVLEDGLTVNP
jgi:hypothetical protein